MTAFYQQIYKMVVSGTASSAVFTDLQSLNAKNGEILRGLSQFYRQSAKPLKPRQNSADKKVMQLESSRPISAPVQVAVAGTIRLIDAGLRLGDVVRSQDHYWKRTRRQMTGAIVRFEPVPEEQIAFVGSDHWAYLNSGEGPVSLAILAKVPECCDEPESGEVCNATLSVAPECGQSVFVR